MNIKQLHDRDFNLWTEETRKALENKDVNAIDWENLIEELADMGASQKRALRSYYYRLVEHILKLRDWNEEIERNEIKWRVEVTNFRTSIQDILDDSPSLKNYLEDNHLDWCNKVIKNYQKNPQFTLKNTDPIELDLMMNEDFYG
ncbi:MAG: DUF29 domain-containing protein [Cyanobacteria bacterium P01_G01_bin.49]